MTVERHLILQEKDLPPSVEWLPRSNGWLAIRVGSGQGYWLQSGLPVRPLAAGDVLMIGRNSDGILRASQLGPVKLHYFTVLPQLLSGVLTLAESHQFDADPKAPARPVAAFGATDPVGQKFTALAALAVDDHLPQRCACLQLWSEAVAGMLPAAAAPSKRDDKLRDRFRQLVGQIPETELAGHSLADLAGQLHCSERHFSRLFREEFGASLRARQIELRLQRARQLLAGSNAKIINVAYESGYRHLGLFNSMFKKRFGVTPSEWRRQSLQKNVAARSRTPVSRLVAWAGVAVLFLLLNTVSVLSAWAADATAATNTATAKVKPHFEVRHYDVEGNTILTAAQIGQIFTNVPGAFGPAVTFDDISAALTALQRAYHERGYVTVSVTLPQQKLANATVRVKVVEGNLVDIEVTGNRWYSERNVRRALPSLHTNMFLNNQVFQRELDTANASRDRQIYPVVGPGPDPGTSELTLKVKDQFPMHARTEINNDNTIDTPDLRVNTTAQYDNLWDLEHQFGIQYGFSADAFKNAGPYNITFFNNAFVDAPMIDNYSAYYRIPLGGYAQVQQLIDENPSRFGYDEVTHKFNLPPVSGRPDFTIYASRSLTDSGVTLNGLQVVNQTNNSGTVQIGQQPAEENVTVNEAIGAKVNLPLPPVGNVASTLSFGLDYKHYELRSAEATLLYELGLATNSSGQPIVFGTPVITIHTPYQLEVLDYVPFNVGWSGSAPDPWGVTFFNAQANFNVLPLSSDKDFGAASYTTNAHSQYATVLMGMDRDQRIYHDWAVKLHADGQWATGALFNNEQYGMGGSGGVRGYEGGQDYGDTGWRLSVEPHTPAVNIGMVDGDQPFWLRASTFVDYGETHRFDDGPYNHQFLGTGFGMTANIGTHWDARLTLAWPLLSNNDGTPVGQVHVYFGVGAQF